MSTITSRLVISLVVAAALAPAAYASKTLNIGQTYPIAEPDVVDEIKAAAAKKDWHSWMRRAPKDYGAFQSADLPRAQKDDSYLFDPTYSLPQDLKNEKGEVLYPAGYKINVYTKIHMKGRYIVIGPGAEDFRWLDKVAKPTAQDKVLLASGNALVVRQTTGRQIYELDDRAIERFGLKHIPSIVTQEGLNLRVTEYVLDTKKEASP